MAELVHLVRHGQVHNPQNVVYACLPSFRLSERGARQARDAGDYLADRPIGAVWSSPLERALQTARHLASPHGLQVEVRPDLVEWKLLNRWAGRLWADLPELFPGEVEAYLQHPDDLHFTSERLSELAGRIGGVIAEAAASEHSEVVIVGHQDPLQSARLALTGRPLDRLFCDRPEHGSVITLQPGTPWTEITNWIPSS